ncbi:hypothetical protein DYQ86_13030 [Acidobacteria bacterium AB60]|nr:hypothetical protein DYQ86_13030 [Acidobacteria bacterium AB60]
MHWIFDRPLILALAVLIVIGLAVVVVDFIQYFGYYIHNHWTEATWIDDLTGQRDSSDASEDTDAKPQEIPIKHGAVSRGKTENEDRAE